MRLAASTDLRHFSSLAQKRDLRVLIQAVQTAQDIKTATIAVDDEKTDDEDVEGLKGASKEPSTEKSIGAGEDAKDEEDVKMELSEETVTNGVEQVEEANADEVEDAKADAVEALSPRSSDFPVG